jgi:hypothetical protein
MRDSILTIYRKSHRILKAIPILGLTLVLALVLVVVVNNAMPAFADTTTAHNAGTGANVLGPGTVNWTNPGNITADDTNYATANLGINATSEYLQGTNYGFAIPAGATISGIAISIMRQSSSNNLGYSVNDSNLRLLKAGTLVGSNYAVTTDWPTSMTAATYGGAADLWGTTWTPAQINASDFGVSLSAYNQSPGAGRIASVDYMQITVTYTPALTPTTLTVDAATGTYGGTASLTATLSPAVAGKTISFTLNGVPAGTAGTDGSGVANIPAADLTGINAGSYPAGVGASFAGDASYDPSTGAADLTVNLKDLTVTAAGINKVYDGGVTATVNLSTDALAGDDVTASYLSASFADKNVDTGKAVTVSGISISGSDAGNYNLLNTTAATAADITPKELTITGITGSDKVYDGTTAAIVDPTGAVLVGVIGTEDVGVDDSLAVATFDDKNVGNPKTVTVNGLILTGADAGNYTLTPPTTTANITQRDLTVTAAGINKVYDGGLTATVNLSTDAVGGDNVTASYSSASFADKNVGTGKAVSVSGISIGGSDAGNYNLLNTTDDTAADIIAATLTVTGITADIKTYDGTTDAVLNVGSAALVGVIGVEDVTLDTSSAVGTFVTKNAGTGIVVLVSGLTLSGADAGNYTLTPPTTTADITQRDLTVTAASINKPYDGTDTATVNLSTDALGSDNVTVSYSSASFDDNTVGTGKAVSVGGISISGSDAGNYNLLNDADATTADITARELTITGITGSDKVYDGTTDAVLNVGSAALVGVIGVEDVTLDTSSAVGTFDNKNAGSGKTVTVMGLVLTGADAGNYTLIPPTTTANITQRDLTVTAAGINKVYDGGVTATVNLSTDAIGGDTVTAGYSASFADKNVGTGKAVSVIGISIGGADAGNYNLLNTTASTTANITAKALMVTATGVNKVYDGTTVATVTLS